MSRLEQVAAGVRVGEAADAQAVGGVQLAEEELAAGVPHPVELQQAGGWQQRLGTEQETVSQLQQLLRPADTMSAHFSESFISLRG